MIEPQFVSVSLKTRRRRAALRPLWRAYLCHIFDIAKPLKWRQRRTMNEELDKRLKDVNPDDYFFEILYLGRKAVGFYNCSVDGFYLSEILKVSGCGYVQEFYIDPAYRRQGLGRLMFARVQNILRPKLTLPQIYGTPADDNARSFWKALGWADTGKKNQSGSSIWVYETHNL